MKLPYLAIALAVLFANPSPPDKGTAHETPLEGTWSLCSLQIDMHPGEVINLDGEDVRSVCHLIITEDHYTLNLGDGSLEMAYKLYPNAKPPAIDLTLTAGPDKGKTFRGIYKLDGDTLTVCRSSALEKERPKAFAVEPGSWLMMTVWKRKKN